MSLRWFHVVEGGDTHEQKEDTAAYQAIGRFGQQPGQWFEAQLSMRPSRWRKFPQASGDDGGVSRRGRQRERRRWYRRQVSLMANRGSDSRRSRRKSKWDAASRRERKASDVRASSTVTVNARPKEHGADEEIRRTCQSKAFAETG